MGRVGESFKKLGNTVGGIWDRLSGKEQLRETERIAFQQKKQIEKLKTERDNMDGDSVQDASTYVDRGKDIARQRNEERRKRNKEQGRQSTIKSSPLGVVGQSTTSKKTLLGA